MRLFEEGRFFTASGRARFVAVGARAPAVAPDADYPFVLNTGRIRDQWHTMSRTGRSARLSAHLPEPFVEIHPRDARVVAIADGELVQVESRRGAVVVKARISEGQRPGTLFIPMHWNDQYAARAVVDALVAPVTDSLSGQPEFKHTPVRVTPWEAGWYGFLLSRRRLSMDASGYWSMSRGKGIWRYELAGREQPDDWACCARSLLCQEAERVEWIEFHDRGVHRYRAARLENGRLESCIFIGPDSRLPPRDYLVTLFERERLDTEERRSLLTGKPARPVEDAGPVVCACFGVGLHTIEGVIRSEGITTVEAIGERLKAGTNCGSCLPELARILAASATGPGPTG